MTGFKTTKGLMTAMAGSILLLLAGAPAHAVDGTREISQLDLDAAAGGPFTITAPGSYVLTSDLAMPNADTPGILVTADDVTIDLNGFSIRCDGCAPFGSGSGVSAGPATRNVAVRNGSVSGAGRYGVGLEGLYSTVEGVRVTGCGVAGIFVGERSRLVASQATENARGVMVGRDSLVTGVLANRNTGTGVTLSEFAMATTTTSSENSGFGFSVTEGSVLLDVTSTMNDGKGIQGEKSLVAQSTVTTNQGDGIECPECAVLRSVVGGNGGYGIEGDKTGYGHNVIQFNSSGPVRSSLQLNQNVCNLTVGCPN